MPEQCWRTNLPRYAMPLQLDHDGYLALHTIMAHTSRRLVVIHRAYAEGRLTPTHVRKARQLRNSLASLIARFGDGPWYGAVEPDMVAAMRHMETAANALLCSAHGIDDARDMVA